MRFDKASLEYILRMNTTGGRNIHSKDRHLKRHLIPFFGAMQLDKITSFDVQRFVQLRLSQHSQAGGDHRTVRSDKSVSPGSVNRELATLSHLFTMAEEWEWTRKRPRIRRLREGAGRTTYLSQEQAQRLLTATTGHLRLFVLIGLSTAMRRSEILSLRWENVDSDRRLIYLPRAKAGPREVPMTKALADHLREYPKTSPWLFPSQRSKTGHLLAIEGIYRRAVASVGMDPKQVVRHTLRHSAVTHLVQAGVDLPTVMRVSGHRSVKMIMRYAHQDDAHVRQAMDKLEARLT